MIATVIKSIPLLIISLAAAVFVFGLFQGGAVLIYCLILSAVLILALLSGLFKIKKQMEEGV